MSFSSAACELQHLTGQKHRKTCLANAKLVRLVLMWFVPHQSCAMCKDPRASVHTFKKLMWLLDPQYKDASKKHYKAFDDLFGENTSEIECPSAKIHLVKME